jgi:hypothetical protein
MMQRVAISYLGNKSHGIPEKYNALNSELDELKKNSRSEKNIKSRMYNLCIPKS